MKKCSKSIILVNASVITMDPLLPRASWVAVGNDRILSIGNGNDWKELKNKNSRIFDCKKRTVLPGFIDAHLHLVSYAKSLVTLNLSPGGDVHSIPDIQSIIRIVRDDSRGRASGEWIIGRGYNDFHLDEKRHPNRWELDRATSAHPVKLTHRSLHAHALNSLALKSVGIGKETGDPEGGMIDRDLETGEPTGILYEMGAFLADRIPPIASAELERGVGLANRRLLSSGVTSIHDASLRNDGDRWNLFKSWKASGILRPRVRMMVGCHAFKEKKYETLVVDGDENQLQPGAVKIILDDTTGRLNPSREALNEMVLEIHQAGRQVAIHAIEEKIIEAACNAIQYALDRAPRKEHRHRIEHCSVCPPSLARRIASLGIVVVTQPPFIYHGGERYLETVRAEQLEHLYPFRSLLDSGVEAAGGSDCPVVSPEPLVGIYAAISRMGERGGLVGGREKISTIEALEMYTRNAARASFEETVKGCITPGNLADLVVLDGDLEHLPPSEIKNLKVEMTIIGGEVVWKT